MIPFKRIAIGPLVLVAVVGWFCLDLLVDGDAPIRVAGLGLLAAVPLYLALALLCTLFSVVLQHFGKLSRRSLLECSSAMSLALAGSVGYGWLSLGSPAKATSSFFFVFSLAFLAGALLCVAWWRMASLEKHPQVLDKQGVFQTD
jgi:hypothetical protein